MAGVSDQINRVKFISEDFATYRAEADSFFQTYYPEDFNNLIATDLGNALMDQIAFAMQALTFSVNRRASELFLSTSRLNKSITKLARMLGYPIQSAAPASTNLTIVLKNGAYAYPITIPSGFQFRGPGDTIYEYVGAIPVVIAPGNTTVTIPVKEGSTKRLSFVSDGSENQEFGVFGLDATHFLYSEDMIVTVDGNAWERLGMIKYENANTFEVLFTEDPPKLKFGDNIAGNIPEDGSQIVMIHRIGKGSKGAVGKDQIKSPVNQLVINGVTIPLTLTNTVSNVGQDPEDLRHVKAFASTFFRSQQAAVVKQDYDSIAALETGVALADAQTMRGIDADLTVQAAFAGIHAGEALIQGAVSGIVESSVTGTSFLGVSGTPALFVGGVSGLGVGNTAILGVSGISFLGSDVSGNVTGISYLGVSGSSGLTVTGSGGLFVGGISSLGVSGLGFLGLDDHAAIISGANAGISGIESNVTGLHDYLSQVFSDTSKANNVQVVVLASDANNKYIAPTLTTLQNVQAKLQSLADAVVTVVSVDGTPNLVPVDVEVDMGISQVAVKDDVESKSLNALIGTSTPFGLLVKRDASKSLYVSDIEDAIRQANTAGDVRYINVVITGPVQYLDAFGNLVIDRQKIIQNNNVTVKVTKRFLVNGETVDV